MKENKLNIFSTRKIKTKQKHIKQLQNEEGKLLETNSGRRMKKKLCHTLLKTKYLRNNMRQIAPKYFTQCQ